MANVDEWQTEMQLKPVRLGRISLCTSSWSNEERVLTGAKMITNLDGRSFAASRAEDLASR